MRYFFHVEDGDSFFDEEGQELSTATAAKIEAARLLGELLKDRAEAFWDHRTLRLIVTDDRGLILFVLDLSAVQAPALTLPAMAS